MESSFIPSTIRRRRNQRRWTLTQVAAVTGMSTQHLSEIESGKRKNVQLSSIERIATALGLTLVLVPNAMAPAIRRYIDNQGRSFTRPFSTTNSGDHDE